MFLGDGLSFDIVSRPWLMFLLLQVLLYQSVRPSLLYFETPLIYEISDLPAA